jgi:hypothetical protein
MNQTGLKSGGTVLLLTFTFFLLHPTHCLAFLDCPDMNDTFSNGDVQTRQDVQKVKSSHDHHSAHNELCGNLFTQDDRTWQQLLNIGPTCVGSGICTTRDQASLLSGFSDLRLHSPSHERLSTSGHLSLNVFLC